jgi:hypothetical protein
LPQNRLQNPHRFSIQTAFKLDLANYLTYFLLYFLSLGKYDAPSVSKLIASGMDPVAASRDIYSNSIQLAEVKPEELQELCQYHMDNYGKRG